MTWMPPTNHRGRVPTMRVSGSGEIVEYDALDENDFRSGRVYTSCECPCGCIRTARYFPGGASTRPYLCGACVEPGDHERELTEDERAILARPT